MDFTPMWVFVAGFLGRPGLPAGFLSALINARSRMFP